MTNTSHRVATMVAHRGNPKSRFRRAGSMANSYCRRTLQPRGVLWPGLLLFSHRDLRWAGRLPSVAAAWQSVRGSAGDRRCGGPGLCVALRGRGGRQAPGSPRSRRCWQRTRTRWWPVDRQRLADACHDVAHVDECAIVAELLRRRLRPQPLPVASRRHSASRQTAAGRSDGVAIPVRADDCACSVSTPRQRGL